MPVSTAYLMRNELSVIRNYGKLLVELSSVVRGRGRGGEGAGGGKKCWWGWAAWCEGGGGGAKRMGGAGQCGAREGELVVHQASPMQLCVLSNMAGGIVLCLYCNSVLRWTATACMT